MVLANRLFFEGFNWYRWRSGQFGTPHDPAYFPKTDQSGHSSAAPQVEVAFHEGSPSDLIAHRKSFRIRPAYRHEADFTANQFGRQTPFLEDPGLGKLIQAEQTVRKNYERLASQLLQGVFDPSNDDKRVAQLREEHIGRIQRTLKRVFGDLTLRSPGDIIEDGTFFFDKGASSRFHYKNLSGGEKAAFDLILDFHIRGDAYDDTVFCIDEPELHLGSRVQALLLASLYEETPPNCQIWIATHSLGMMRQAFDLHRENAEQVVFLDTSHANFDTPTTLTSAAPGRAFWRQVLEVSLDDMAGLVAPGQVILCEGANPSDGFDAAIYRSIFAEEFPDAEFLSVGNSSEVKRDHAGIASAIEVLAPRTRILRLIDRDEHTDDEIAALRKKNIRVLNRRNMESYLLADEVLSKLCKNAGKVHKINDAIKCRDIAVAQAVARGRPQGDFKSARGSIQVFARKELGLRHSGSDADEFLRKHVAPLIPDTNIYQELRQAILG